MKHILCVLIRIASVSTHNINLGAKISKFILTLVLLNAFANSVKKPTSRSALLVTMYVILYQQPGSSNLIGWKIEMGMASWFIQHDKG